MRIALLALGLTACATMAPETRPPGPDDSCGSSHVSNLIGQARSDSLAAEVARRSGARRVRWIRPGDVVTMDFSSDRLNVYLDARDRIQSVSCG